MKKFSNNSMKALAFSASAIAFVMAGPVYAQDAGDDQADDEDEEQVDVTTDATGEPAAQGGITVTGSRIVRDTYSSISPLQVLTTENQQSVGAFDPAQILQRSEAAAGQQIDATFQGFVLDNGPGSQTVNLRGLGAVLGAVLGPMLGPVQHVQPVRRPVMAHHPFARRLSGSSFGDYPLKVADGTGRQQVAVDRGGGVPEHVEMAVDQTRNGRSPAQIDDLCIRADLGLYVGTCPDRDKATVPDRSRLGTIEVRVHSQD